MYSIIDSFYLMVRQVEKNKKEMMKWSQPNLKYYPGKFLDRLRKTTKSSVKIISLQAKV
jgi:hypothetical protein